MSPMYQKHILRFLRCERMGVSNMCSVEIYEVNIFQNDLIKNSFISIEPQPKSCR